MTETLSDVYYRQGTQARREAIKGNRVSGVENESITQFMGDMYQNATSTRTSPRSSGRTS